MYNVMVLMIVLALMFFTCWAAETLLIRLWRRVADALATLDVEKRRNRR